MKIVIVVFSFCKWAHAAALGFMGALAGADYWIGGDMWSTWLSLAGVNVLVLTFLYIYRGRHVMEESR